MDDRQAFYRYIIFYGFRVMADLVRGLGFRVSDP